MLLWAATQGRNLNIDYVKESTNSWRKHHILVSYIPRDSNQMLFIQSYKRYTQKNLLKQAFKYQYQSVTSVW